MKISPARRAAFEILRRVEDEGAYSSTLLAAIHETLDAKDRALCHELVLGVLRNRLWLDRSIEYFGSRKIERLDLPVRLALRLGLYQIKFLSRIPSSAAVNEAVNLTHLARVRSASTFVNAVLRRATRETDYDPASSLTDERERLSIETSHPRWLIDRWSSQFGFDETAALARANNQPAVLAFRFTAKARRDFNRPPGTLIEELKTAGVCLVESKIAPDGWRVERAGHPSINDGDVASPDESLARIRSVRLLQQLAEQGLIYFQDEASQLVAHLVEAHTNDRILDVCAAPGSKLTLLSALAPDALIVGADLYAPRAQIILQFAQQQDALNVAVVQHDATQRLPFPARSFDGVLVDAPCSGTGTLRHNPEIRWRLTETDIAKLREKQQLILQNAATVTRVGGRLVYSTCSIETDENEGVIAKFLHDNPGFKPAIIRTPSALLTKDGYLRTWPHREDVEGFFFATLQRNV